MFGSNLSLLVNNTRSLHIDSQGFCEAARQERGLLRRSAQGLRETGEERVNILDVVETWEKAVFYVVVDMQMVQLKSSLIYEC